MRSPFRTSRRRVEVADAFEEVQRADRDKQRLVEEANQYATRARPGRGDAQIRKRPPHTRIASWKAGSEAQRFSSVSDQYSKAPEVTESDCSSKPWSRC